MDWHIQGGEFIASVAVLVVAQVKVRASSKSELEAKLRQELTTAQGDWDLQKFYPKEASLQVVALGEAFKVSSRRPRVVEMKVRNDQLELGAQSAFPQAN